MRCRKWTVQSIFSGAKPMSRIANPVKRALTSRGAATKRRIVEAAAELIYAKGAERVSLDAVMEATGASKSQLYHYFESKDALVREVIEVQTSRILSASSLLCFGME
jgi:TetR/AcrR family transcriptional regulator, transcriptional repressor for nem operon